MLSRIFGATWVGISGRGSKRCALARKYGASVVYDASAGTVDVVAATLKATGGRGADVVVDCAGAQDTLDTALKAARPGGTIMNVAGWAARPTIDMNLMLMKELVLASEHVPFNQRASAILTRPVRADSMTYAGDHPELIQALADGKFDLDDLEALITRRVGLEDYLEKGLGALLHEKDQHGGLLRDVRSCAMAHLRVYSQGSDSPLKLKVLERRSTSSMLYTNSCAFHDKTTGASHHMTGCLEVIKDACRQCGVYRLLVRAPSMPVVDWAAGGTLGATPRGQRGTLIDTKRHSSLRLAVTV